MSNKRFIKFHYEDGSYRTIEIKSTAILHDEADKQDAQITIPAENVCMAINKINKEGTGYNLLINDKFWNPQGLKLTDIQIIQ